MKAIDTLWNGEQNEDALHYTLKVCNDLFIFTVKFPTGVKGHPDAVKGEYTPGLWKWDVAEVFLLGDNGKYVELNLSPNGAWWAQGFADVREADSFFKASDYSFITNSKDAEVSLSFSLKAVEHYLGDYKNWRGNVTAILNSPDYHFLSATSLLGEEADFHQPISFPPLSDLITS